MQICGTFTDRSMHLLNLFVYFRNAELRNKIALCTTYQKEFFVKMYYISVGPFVAVER
jgi:hypothetical protein